MVFPGDSEGKESYLLSLQIQVPFPWNHNMLDLTRALNTKTLGKMKTSYEYHQLSQDLNWSLENILKKFNAFSTFMGLYRPCSVQFSSVVQSCMTPCNPMNRSTPGLPVHHQLRESTQTHVHRVSDAIPSISSSVVPFSSCPQSFPASGSFQMSQFFARGGQSIGVSASASVPPMTTQD